LIVQITTAGVGGTETICERQYQYGRKVATGEADDYAYLFRWFQAADGSDHRDPQAWAAANPSYGVIVRDEF
jgi:phage terminase large subunit-like protein